MHISFQSAPFRLEIPQPGFVHLWDASGVECRVLSHEEERHASAFRSLSAKRCFIRGRSGARLAAARYLGCDPASLDIVYDPNGKPVFSKLPDLSFNISHSKEHVWIAMSSESVGLDIEELRNLPSATRMARRFLSKKEYESIAAAGDGASILFLQTWTAKEAMLKLTGHGLAGGLSACKVLTSDAGEVHGRPVSIRRLQDERVCAAVAAHRVFEVNGWFAL